MSLERCDVCEGQSCESCEVDGEIETEDDSIEGEGDYLYSRRLSSRLLSCPTRKLRASLSYTTEHLITR